MAIHSSTRLVFTAISVSVAVIATGAFSTAKAAQFNFSYTGTGINASGVIATDATGTLNNGNHWAKKWSEHYICCRT
jgi:hypothetical protein